MLIEGVKVAAEVAFRIDCCRFGKLELGLGRVWAGVTVLAFENDAPFEVSQRLAGGALELRPNRGNPEPIAGSLCGLLVLCGVWSLGLRQRVECATKDRFATG
jgi:hypothetical protein